jgi:hypothetical protein
MRSLSTALCLLALLAGSAAAQERVDIFGYLESQMVGTRLQGSFYQWYTNKLRVDLKSSLSEHITFTANINYITHHGKTHWEILEFLSDGLTAEIPLEIKPYYVLRFSNETFLDNAYLKLSFKHFDLTLGKQQISLGTGYVWNPTDVFNVKDVLDPTYEQPGHNAVRVDVPLGALSSLTFLYSPEAAWRESGKMLRWRGCLSHFDVSLVALEILWTFHDYTRLDPETGMFPELPERRRLLGGSTAGEVLGLGVWAEFAYNWMERSRDFHELVVGANYTFDVQTFVMLEYYRNTLGKANAGGYDLNDWMRFYAAEQKAIARDQLYLLVQHPATDLLEVGVQAAVCLSDSSLALVPTLRYFLSDNVDVFAYFNINLGKEGSVFARSMGEGGLLRVRVYF